MKIADYCTGIQHIGIPTNDLEKTLAFYKGIGFSAVLETLNEKSREKVAFLQNGNLVLEIYENHCACMKTGAVDHICIDVTNIEKVFECIKNGHFQLLDEQIQFLPFWENGVRFFTIVGPNEEKIEFAQKL
ncbi:VOC family protein [Caproiciproducens galactitolivorans]|uniref:VOC family protein n=1 Tax=Caproiciproducens galactitolivorans TaxID=642589 RepID=A0ABT4BWA4_9FIRM|nr:VOC family protein [Caproiciproducens galactitolivorans]MCY1715167.1 VOC family protein [Caproiciproducens galactitolivorans]